MSPLLVLLVAALIRQSPAPHSTADVYVAPILTWENNR